ncbi:MAG: twin-arginine translocation signal domain-containing protein [bacterium]
MKEGMPGTGKNTQSQSEPERIDRRVFLRGVLAGGAAVAAGPLAPQEAQASTAQEIHEGMKNVAELETENAKYKIVYSLHNIPTNPGVLERSDALVLEMTDINDGEIAKSEVTTHMNGHSGASGKLQYQDVLPTALDRGMPVYFADAMGFSEEAVFSEMIKREVITQAEGTVGIGALVGGAISLKKNQSRPDRRKLLGGIAGLTSGIWLNMPRAENLVQRALYADNTREPEEGSLYRTIDKKLTDANYHLHPETRTKVRDVRNTLIAQKAEKLGKWLTAKLDKKPT